LIDKTNTLKKRLSLSQGEGYRSVQPSTIEAHFGGSHAGDKKSFKQKKSIVDGYTQW
jgi:hypothetical protein